MKPDLEVVQIGRAEFFKAWEHGYPFRTVRWHFHPEFEIHHVVSTTGHYFVGDFIGSFQPGNLVLTGGFCLPHRDPKDRTSGRVRQKSCLVKPPYRLDGWDCLANPAPEFLHFARLHVNGDDSCVHARPPCPS